MKGLKIYDNGGKTIDRYTVILDGAVFTMSYDPLSPQGVNQYLGREVDCKNQKWGKEIKFSQVNNAVQQAINLRANQQNRLLK